MHDDDFRLQFGGELAKLKELGISESQIDELQIVFLPENVFTFRDRSELHDAGDSLALAKALKQEGVRCATAYDLGLDIPVPEIVGLAPSGSETTWRWRFLSAC
jgi:hypothetical protein